MIATAGDLITLALKASGVNGVGQTPIAEDANDALSLLAMMIAGWQRDRWLVPDLIDLSLLSTGALSYAVGPNGDFSVTRPERIDAAFARLATPGSIAVDYPLTVIRSREEYNQIGLKALTTFPAAVFYDSAWPTGNLFFWPVPTAGQYNLHITIKSALPVYANLTDPIALPPEYTEALLYNLALRLAVNFGEENPSPALANAARATLATVRAANVQMTPLQMPADLVRRNNAGSISGSVPLFNAIGSH